MQTSPGISSDKLADELMAFFVHLMQGDQGELFAVVAELDLTMPQMRGMFVLNGSQQALALTELAPRMGLSVAAAGRAVDGLVRKGLVSRTEDPDDRRIKRLSVTDDGLAAIVRIAEARREGFRRFAETLDPQRRAVLAEAFATALRSEEESP
ncbi:MAG TPA: MarR family transcriptional regulator [Conexibacter sp.]|nr:MarR family transcriptional regulator [Conexibacter sp.]